METTMKRLVFRATNPRTGTNSDHEVIAETATAAMDWLAAKGIYVSVRGYWSELWIDEPATDEFVRRFANLYGIPGVPHGWSEANEFDAAPIDPLAAAIFDDVAK